MDDLACVWTWMVEKLWLVMFGWEEKGTDGWIDHGEIGWVRMWEDS